MYFSLFHKLSSWIQQKNSFNFPIFPIPLFIFFTYMYDNYKTITLILLSFQEQPYNIINNHQS